MKLQLTLFLYVLLLTHSHVSFNFTKEFNSKKFQQIKQQTKLEEENLDFDLKNEIPFNCPKIPPSSTVPEDATKLRFSDIKVQMALGDSITAGFSMVSESYVGSIFEYRGLSGFIGSDKNAHTVFNFFKKIGNNIEGGSRGVGLPWNYIVWPWQVRPHSPSIDKLNGAQSNARTHQLAKQLHYVIQQAKKDKNIDYEKDWKMVTILIGANDLFQCQSSGAHPDEYTVLLNRTLSTIHEKIPRVFVNIMYLFEDGFIDTFNNGKDNTYCKSVWKLLENAIPCMVKNDHLRAKMKQMIVEYNRRIFFLAKYWNEKSTRKDFHIAIQTPLKNIRVKDRSWSSKFDCFHPSLKANKLISYALWNSMQLPFDKKPTGEVNEILCPTETTFMQ
eukprot:gene8612-559_t